MYGIDVITCYILQVADRNSRGFGYKCGKFMNINMQTSNILPWIINIDTQILNSGFEHFNDDKFQRFNAMGMFYVHRLVNLRTIRIDFRLIVHVCI